MGLSGEIEKNSQEFAFKHCKSNRINHKSALNLPLITVYFVCDFCLYLIL